MSLNLATLLPAKIGTSEIATKANITTSLAAYDPATVINTGITTIDGGKITTGSITADRIAANAITADKINADAINGRIIEGLIIKGSYIEGSVIKSSWIDYTSSGDLTNWQFYTLANRPTAYDANFAKNNDGSFVVDGSGYVRLVGKANVYSTFSTISSPSSYGANTISIATDGVYPYNSYTQSNTNRCVSLSPVAQLNTTVEIATLVPETSMQANTISFTFLGKAFYIVFMMQDGPGVNYDDPTVYWTVCTSFTVDGVSQSGQFGASPGNYTSVTYTGIGINVRVSVSGTRGAVELIAGSATYANYNVSSGFGILKNMSLYMIYANGSGRLVCPSILYR